jgi:hypothetical protein
MRDSLVSLLLVEEPLRGAMKRLGVLGIVVSLLLVGAACSTGGEIANNLEAADVTVGTAMAEIDVESNYAAVFFETVPCSSITVTGSAVRYTTSQDVAAPYVMWVFYPQVTKSSRATVMAFDRSDKVMAVFRMDTDRAIREFGGTYGTRKAGW